MKKLFLILLLVYITASMSSCWILFNPSDTSETDVIAEEVGIAYSDGENAFYIYISEPNWAYYKYDDGTVMFYDKEKNDGITGFAISSTVAGDTNLSEDQSADVIDSLWSQTVSYYGQYSADLEWHQNEDIIFGDYTAKRYSYTAEFSDTDGEVEGDYFFWAFEDRIYICSFAAYPNDYDKYFTIMEESLVNFIALSK